jgi:methyl-accepting chemotaxis protein
MPRQRTFGQKLGAGFALTILLSVAIGVVAVYALRNVVASKDRVITVDAQLVQEAESMRSALERKGGANRGFLLTRDERFVAAKTAARSEFLAGLDRLRRLAPTETAHSIDTIAKLEADHQEESDRVLALRRSDATIEVVVKEFDEKVVPKRDRLDTAIRDFIAAEKQQLETSRIASTESASSATNLVIGIGVGAVLLGIVLAFILARTLSRQIAGAVGQVQSSSAELQATANQQATAAKEQASAMNEISTTISELLATSRQIAESAQRVAQIAGQTATAAKAGDGTVGKAHGSIAAIRQQVDLVVTHMLDLGKKSQQIGAVLEIVSELAEQTNILAINATIEAAGAGEAGRRFAVVADEIRKLADRVAASTKEVRALIDDVRTAVNTTVMATETGSKAVDAGSKQFGDVASSFQQIAGLVTTTTEASREIELSTKQQTTAVEQVNLAIANVAQATQETEASSGQTLTTASQLAGLSKELLRLVQPHAE